MENLFIATEKRITMDKSSLQVKVAVDSAVKKLLTSSARVTVLDSECQNGVLQVTGRVFAEVVYIDSSDLVCRAENTIDFVEKQKVSFDLSDVLAKSIVCVQNVNVAGNDVICNIAQEIQVTGIYKYEIPKIEDDSNELVIDKKEFSMSKLVTVCEDNFVIAEEVEKNLINVEILGSNANVFLTNSAIDSDKVILEGKILAEVTYLQNNEVSCFNSNFDFRQEISAENVNKEMILNANLVFKNIMVTPEIKEDKTTFIFAIDIYAKNYVYENTIFEVANDLFSLKNEVNVTYDYFETQNFITTKSGNESVLSQSDVSALVDFEDLLCVSGAKCRVLNIENKQDNTFVTIEITANAYYKTLEGCSSLEVKNQSVVEINKEEDWSLSNFDVVAEISSYKVKAGKDLEVVFLVQYLAHFETKTSQKFVKTYEIVSEKSNNNYGIKVYVSKEGQTLFDLAKILNVTPELIASQNNIDDVFESGQKIYIYSPVNLV